MRLFTTVFSLVLLLRVIAKPIAVCDLLLGAMRMLIPALIKGDSDSEALSERQLGGSSIVPDPSAECQPNTTNPIGSGALLPRNLTKSVGGIVYAGVEKRADASSLDNSPSGNVTLAVHPERLQTPSTN